MATFRKNIKKPCSYLLRAEGRFEDLGSSE
jgi:hypothetical protein